MKKLLLISLSVLYSMNMNAGCPLVNVSIQDRVNESSIVVEATVESKLSYKNAQGNFIYTAHTLKIHKIFKGNPISEYITLITEGGVVDLEMLDVNPNLNTDLGQSGVFFLTENNSWQNPDGITISYYSRTGPLGFIYYDKDQKEAFDLLNKWGNVASNLRPMLKSITGKEEVFSFPITPKVGFRRIVPTISGFNPTTIPAGTRQVLTITGSDFGATRGNGEVRFKNADDGGGSYISALETDYISWSDTEIKLLVLRRAGTGQIRVFNNSGDFATTVSNLTVPYSHLNVVFSQGPGIPDPTSFETRMIEQNSTNGLTWVWDSQFKTNAAAVSSFIRAIETWRCRTLINWDTLGTISNDTNLKDNKCMVFFDKGWLPSSTLGTCYSWYNGCFTGPSSMDWYVSELDIVFKKSTNWEYGPTNAAGGKTDFESVALHELGHGHQLGHVINNPNVMHFSIGANTNKRILQTNDTACGNYVMNKSVISICGNGAMTKIDPANCQFTQLVADFSVDNMTPCAFDTVTFTDESSGAITSWQWTFGTGATPPTATGKGPHKVVYQIGGNKTVKLDVTAGSATETKLETPLFNVKSHAQPTAEFLATPRRACDIEFLITNPVATTTYTWDFDGQGSTNGNNPTFSFANGGQVNVSVTASNNCGSIMVDKDIDFICVDFETNMDTACISDTVIFTNLSEPVTTLSWNFGAGASPATALGVGPHTVVYSNGGEKSVSLQITSGIISQAVFGSVFIKDSDKPVAAFIPQNQGNNTILFLNQSTGLGITHQWNFGDGSSINTEQSPVYTYASNPTGLNVILTSTNSCAESQAQVQLSDYATIGQVSVTKPWNIYPNPASDQLFVKAQSGSSESIQRVSITDLTGKIVYEQTWNNNQSIDISQLSSGIYTLHILGNSGVYSYQFSKI